MSKGISAINGMGSITDLGGGDFDTTGMRDSGVMHLTSDLISGNGGVTYIADGSLEVEATSPASDEVTINAGYAYIRNDAWVLGGNQPKFWHVRIETPTDIQIPANASGNPRVDLICLAVDPSEDPIGDDGENAINPVVVQGTPAGSPTPPAVPDKHIALAQIAVANGFSTIVSGNITDRRARPQMTNNIETLGYEEIGRTTLGSAGNNISVASLPARNVLRIMLYAIPTGGTIQPDLTFNDVTSSTYKRYGQANFDSVFEQGNESRIRCSGALNMRVLILADITNYTSENKLASIDVTASATSSSNPDMTHLTIKGHWNSTARISKINFSKGGGSGSYAAGSEIIVLGKN